MRRRLGMQVGASSIQPGLYQRFPCAGTGLAEDAAPDVCPPPERAAGVDAAWT